ncbi:unnamed protein product, partial [Ceratitis capitata]
MPTDDYMVVIKADTIGYGRNILRATRCHHPSTKLKSSLRCGNTSVIRGEDSYHFNLRAKEYIHSRDEINNDGNAANKGQLVILLAAYE